MINILIRMSGRHEMFYRCIKSIVSQTYKNIRVIVSYDRIEDEKIIPNWCDKIFVQEKKENAFYNLYCNTLKAMVNKGWFYFQDSDDYLASPTVLEELSHHLFEGALIVQFLRNKRTKKPTDRMIHDKVIKKGMIGGGCLVLHHSFANVADWKAKPAADYDYIKAVTDVVPTRFVPLVLQIADVKNNGR